MTSTKLPLFAKNNDREGGRATNFSGAISQTRCSTRFHSLSFFSTLLSFILFLSLVSATISHRIGGITDILMLEKPDSPSVNGAHTSHIRKRSIRGGFRDPTPQQLPRSLDSNANARQSLITPFLKPPEVVSSPAIQPQSPPTKSESAPSAPTLNTSRSSPSPSRPADTSQILKGVIACLDIR